MKFLQITHQFRCILIFWSFCAATLGKRRADCRPARCGDRLRCAKRARRISQVSVFLHMRNHQIEELLKTMKN